MTVEQTSRTYGEIINIVVDEQNDFFPGGALGVEGGDAVIDPTNAITAWTDQLDGIVIRTGDRHPRETAHFAENGGIWPVHCVAGTEGAEFRADLNIKSTDARADKGLSLVDDGYSGTEAIIRTPASKAMAIVEDLPESERTVETVIRRVERRNRALGLRTLVLIEGLATDYCVRATGLGTAEITDREWTDIVVLEDAIAAVNLAYDDGEKAIAEMKASGIKFTATYDVIDGGILVDHRGER